MVDRTPLVLPCIYLHILSATSGTGIVSVVGLSQSSFVPAHSLRHVADIACGAVTGLDDSDEESVSDTLGSAFGELGSDQFRHPGMVLVQSRAVLRGMRCVGLRYRFVSHASKALRCTVLRCRVVVPGSSKVKKKKKRAEPVAPAISLPNRRRSPHAISESDIPRSATRHRTTCSRMSG